MANGLRPDIASQMLVRNLVANPSIAPYVAGKLNLANLPQHDSSGVLRGLIDRTSKTGSLTGGDVEQVLAGYPNKQYVRSLQMQASAENHEAIERYLASLREFGESQALRTIIASASLEVTADDFDPTEFKRKLVNQVADAAVAQSELRDFGAYSTEGKEMFQMIRSGNRPGQSFGFGPEVNDAIWADPGTLSIWAGRPGSGKTSAVLSSMLKTATPDKPQAFFSLEMPGYSIAQRAACMIAEVSYFDMVRNRVTEDEFERVMEAMDSLEARGIYVDDGIVTMSDVLYRCMSMPVKPTVIWVDYVELVQPDGNYGRDDLMIASIYIAAKRIAKQLKCHVAMLSQLARSVDEREDKWPTMRDLVRSSAAEKNADYINFIMRPEYYLSRGDSCRILSPGDADGVAYVIVAKSRNGPPTVVRVAFASRLMMFSQYIPPEDLDETATTIGPQYSGGSQHSPSSNVDEE